MITTVTNDVCFEFRGLSTDTKPIGSNCSNKNVDFPIGNGSVFFEMNTSKAFMLKIEATTIGETTTYTGTWLEI